MFRVRAFSGLRFRGFWGLGVFRVQENLRIGGFAGLGFKCF